MESDVKTSPWMTFVGLDDTIWLECSTRDILFALDHVGICLLTIYTILLSYEFWSRFIMQNVDHLSSHLSRKNQSKYVSGRTRSNLESESQP